jgi:hypothetical protein
MLTEQTCRTDPLGGRAAALGGHAFDHEPLVGTVTLCVPLKLLLSEPLDWALERETG